MTDKTMQQRMEEHLARTMEDNNGRQKETMNGMLCGEAIGCNADEKTLTIAFPVQDWQANKVGDLHGGALCSMFDLTMAALARFYAGENFAPTVSIDVKYLRPGKMGDRIKVKATATATGRRITQLTAEAASEGTGKLIATAASVYLNVDTTKE